MVSIKDIAKVCGVSVATVSKALNNHDDIGNETKARIRKTAAELGYSRNPSAHALKTNRTGNIGILFDDPAGSGLGHEYFSVILESLRGEAEKRGYDITFIQHTIAGTETTFLKHCRYRHFDGVVLICADFESREIQDLMESEIPVVTLDYSHDRCSAVLSDNYKGMLKLVSYIVSCGHRKIAFIHGEPTGVTKDRLSAFHRCCRENGIKIPKAYIREGRYHDIEGCRKITEELLTLEDPPTCIVCQDDYSSLGARETILKMGLRIPEDVSVAGYDGIRMARFLKLTTYAQNANLIGRKAVEKLIEKIEDRNPDIEHVEVFGSVLEGATVARL